jgi:FK506-binding protein 2
MGIQGVPKPEKIVTKETPKAEETAKKVGEKVASAVSEAAEAAKTFVADTDDGERDEL